MGGNCQVILVPLIFLLTHGLRRDVDRLRNLCVLDTSDYLIDRCYLCVEVDVT